jgi:hypothetical protein
VALAVSGALIVTAELAKKDFTWADALRRRHFPPERNQLSAHLTMFHALPPSSEPELRTRLAQLARTPAPVATVAGLMDLGGGVAFRIVSTGLDAIRNELVDDLHGLLGAQDAGGWRPHITIQNKVPPKVSRELIGELERGFVPCPLGIAGLGLHRYLGGPWDTLAVYRFRGLS